MFWFATPQAIYRLQQGVVLPTIDCLVVLVAVLQMCLYDFLVVDVSMKMKMGA